MVLKSTGDNFCLGRNARDLKSKEGISRKLKFKSFFCIDDKYNGYMYFNSCISKHAYNK